MIDLEAYLATSGRIKFKVFPQKTDTPGLSQHAFSHRFKLTPPLSILL